MPENVVCEPYSIFSFLFTDDTFQKLVSYTNECAAEHTSEEDKSHARTWCPTTMKEIRAYIAVFISMGVHEASEVSNYWNMDPKEPLHPEITKHIGLKRWQQIDRFLRISRPEIIQPTVFDKLNEL
ncbi:MAG: hypothetical protein Q9198_000119, partial [Flavoplaca austrocitrina]